MIDVAKLADKVEGRPDGPWATFYPDILADRPDIANALRLLMDLGLAAKAESKARAWWMQVQHSEGPTDQAQADKAHEDWCYTQVLLDEAIDAVAAALTLTPKGLAQ